MDLDRVGRLKLKVMSKNVTERHLLNKLQHLTRLEFDQIQSATIRKTAGTESPNFLSAAGYESKLIWVTSVLVVMTIVSNPRIHRTVFE